MKFAAAIGLAATVACAATVARADPLFDEFQALCVKTLADPKPSLAVADADGWIAIPAQMASQIDALFGGDGGGQGRTKAEPRQLMLVGQKVIPAGAAQVKVRLCIVGLAGGDAAAVKTQLAAYAAVTPVPQQMGLGDIAYAFTDDDGSHAVIARPDDDKAIVPLLAAGHVRIAFMQAVPGMTLVGLAVPTK